MIDLHIHSTLSDGTKTPEEIINLVKSKGIRVFSITDHDNIEADKLIRAEYMNLIDDLNLKYISGVEFSCDYCGRTMHILAYGYDSNDEVISEIVSYIHNLRIERINRRLENIKVYHNIQFTDEELQWLYSRNNPGKPHIATLLVKNNYADNIKDAIERFMPGAIADLKVNVMDIVKKLVAHNIIVGIAHPLSEEGDDRITLEQFEESVKELSQYGISFVECYYSSYNPHEREVIKMIADKYGLYLSGGSDYHGENKDVMLGDLGGDYDPQIEDLTILKKIV